MKYGLGALLLVGILVLTGCSKTAPMLHRDGGPAPITAETKPSVQDESVDLSLVPVEYRDQVKESLKLAGDNGSELLKVLQTLTIPEERAGAAFLIGTLPYPDLAAIKADVLLEHIRYAYLIKNKYPWMKNMPEETFLHYVLPYRCAEEPISAYRRYFYEQLDPIVSQCTNLSDVAHQVNLWLGAPKPAPSRTDGVGNGKQRFRFVQTEARDQGPLASLKSGYGRCEEMMIIYICAARSVGVPCRSSWTPYWAICDNNHAWVEVWISGSWKPLGGCEPGAPWFADPAKRAAAVYSATIGKPQSELIHKTIGNSSIINSTPNYSKTCRVKVSVVDADNKPVTDTTVVFAVFNWGSFRPFATKITDGQGQVEFVTGIGEYFLSTGRNDMRAWQVVKTEPGKTLEITFKLAKNAAPDGFIFLRYPTLDQARTSFTTPGLTPVYTSPLTPTYPAPPEIYFYEEFNPALHSDVMALMEGYAGKDAVVQKLKSAGGNWTEMAGAITEIRPELRPDLFHIITQLAHLEAIEVTKEFLLDTVIYADSARSRSKWQIPDDIHKAYVLNPQFEYLHISPWRKELSGRFLPIIIAGYNPDAKIHSDTITDTARAVNEWVAANIKVRGDLGGRFSYVASPLDTLKSKIGDGYGVAIFTAALLRTLVVPAQVKSSIGGSASGGNDWVEFYDGTEWLPLYPNDPKNFANRRRDEATQKEYETKPAGLKLNLLKKGILDPNPWEKVAVSRFQSGYWQYLDWEDLKRYGKWVVVPPGQYLVTAGIRNSNGDPYVYCKQMEFKSGDGIVMNLPLDIPIGALSETERIVRPLKEIPDVKLADLQGRPYNLKEVLEEYNVMLAFFSLNNEPCLRMMPMIDEALSIARDAGTVIWAVYVDPEGKDKFLKDGRLAGLRIPVLIDADQKAISQFIPDFEKNKASVLPSTLLINKDGKTVFWDEGYNMDIERVIEGGLSLLGDKKTGSAVATRAPEIHTEPFIIPDRDYLAEAERYFKEGKYQDAVGSYKKALEVVADDSNIWYNLACAYSLLKQVDEGLNALKKAVEYGWSEFHWMDNDPDLTNLRNDPRYKEIRK